MLDFYDLHRTKTYWPPLSFTNVSVSLFQRWTDLDRPGWSPWPSMNVPSRYSSPSVRNLDFNSSRKVSTSSQSSRTSRLAPSAEHLTRASPIVTSVSGVGCCALKHRPRALPGTKVSLGSESRSWGGKVEPFAHLGTSHIPWSRSTRRDTGTPFLYPPRSIERRCRVSSPSVRCQCKDRRPSDSRWTRYYQPNSYSLQ